MKAYAINNTEQFNYITHYYKKGGKPFLSLSKLSINEALEIANSLKSQPGRVYRRFQNAEWYMKERLLTEEWLRNEFIKLGGEPKCKTPFYFVLGESSHLEEAYEGNFSSVKVRLDDIDENEISFTYPDSMATRFIANENKAEYFNSDYHGKVFTKQEILQIINKHGLPGECWRYDSKRKYDYFIEVQVWNDEFLSRIV